MQHKPTYYTVVCLPFALGHYVKFVAPPDYRIEATDKNWQDPGEASQEFLKNHQGAQCLTEASFTRKAHDLEQQRKADLARLRAWNNG